MDIAFGILLAAAGTLPRRSFPRSVLPILFTHSTTVTPEQAETRDRKTFQFCRSVLFYSLVLWAGTLHFTWCCM